MTKEEIIEGLYHIKNWECNGNAKMHEVVVAAIEALEQEPALYVKTADGYMRGYGSKIYLVGVYDSKDKAEQDGQIGGITKIALNRTYPLTKCADDVLDYENYENENYLGGYAE